MILEFQEIALFAAKIIFIVFFFGFCIFIHEFGHLLVAIWRGLHVEKFSIGFGKPIYKFRRYNIDFLVSWLPFGGYVALPQLDPGDKPKTSNGEPLPLAGPVDRILTAFAGPLFNVIFGFLLATIIWKIGIEGPAPAEQFTVGHVPETYVDGDAVTQPNPEYVAGLRPGDVVSAVNGQSFKKGWQEALELILYSSGGLVQLDVTREGQPIPITYSLVSNPAYEGLGYPFMGPLLPTRVGDVMPGTAAERAGLQSGDLLLEINGESVINAELLISRIQESKTDPITLTVQRGDDQLTISGIQAALQRVGGDERYLIGIQIESVYSTVTTYHPTPWLQFTDVLSRTYKTFRGLFDQKNPIQVRHMSGPVGIFHILYVIVSNTGFIAALNLIILINFSLALINLLPLPILDGGHITLGVFELIFSRRVPTRIILSLSYAFAIILVSFMLYVTYHDARRVGRTIHRPATNEESPAPASSNPIEAETPSQPQAGSPTPASER